MENSKENNYSFLYLGFSVKKNILALMPVQQYICEFPENYLL